MALTQRESLSGTQFSSVQTLSCVQLSATPWITAHQASLSITNSRSSLKLMSIELVMPSSHLILCCRLLLLPPIPPSIRVFSNESTLRMRWPKYWSFTRQHNQLTEHVMTGEIQEHTYLASACDPRADLILSEDYYSFSSSRAACTGRHLSLLGGGTSEFLSLGLWTQSTV